MSVSDLDNINSIFAEYYGREAKKRESEKDHEGQNSAIDGASIVSRHSAYDFSKLIWGTLKIARETESYKNSFNSEGYSEAARLRSDVYSYQIISKALRGLGDAAHSGETDDEIYEAKLTAAVFESLGTIPIVTSVYLNSESDKYAKAIREQHRKAIDAGEFAYTDSERKILLEETDPAKLLKAHLGVLERKQALMDAEADTVKRALDQETRHLRTFEAEHEAQQTLRDALSARSKRDLRDALADAEADFVDAQDARQTLRSRIHAAEEKAETLDALRKSADPDVDSKQANLDYQGVTTRIASLERSLEAAEADYASAKARKEAFELASTDFDAVARKGSWWSAKRAIDSDLDDLSARIDSKRAIVDKLDSDWTSLDSARAEHQASLENQRKSSVASFSLDQAGGDGISLSKADSINGAMSSGLYAASAAGALAALALDPNASPEQLAAQSAAMTEQIAGLATGTMEAADVKIPGGKNTIAGLSLAGAAIGAAQGALDLNRSLKMLDDPTLTEAQKNAVKAQIGVQSTGIFLASMEGTLSAVQAGVKAGTTTAKVLGKAVAVVGAVAATVSLIDPLQWEIFDQKDEYADSVEARGDHSSKLLAEGLRDVNQAEKIMYATEKGVDLAFSVAGAALQLSGVGAPVGFVVSMVGAAVVGIINAIKQPVLDNLADETAKKMRIAEDGSEQTIEEFFQGSLDAQHRDLLSKYVTSYAQMIENDVFDQIVAGDGQIFNGTDIELAGFASVSDELGKTAQNYFTVFDGANLDGYELKYVGQNQIHIPDAGGDEKTLVTFMSPLTATGKEKIRAVEAGKNKTMNEITIEDLDGTDFFDAMGNNTILDLSNMVFAAEDIMGSNSADTRLTYDVEARDGDDTARIGMANVNFNGGEGSDVVSYGKWERAGESGPMTARVDPNDPRKVIVTKPMHGESGIFEAINLTPVQRGKKTEYVQTRGPEYKTISSHFDVVDVHTDIEGFHGSTGDDVVDFEHARGIEQIVTFEGDDTITIGADVLYANGGAGADTFFLSDTLLASLEESPGKAVLVDGGEGLDTLHMDQNWQGKLRELTQYHLKVKEISETLSEALFGTVAGNSLSDSAGNAMPGGLKALLGGGGTSQIFATGIENIMFDIGAYEFSVSEEADHVFRSAALNGDANASRAALRTFFAEDYYEISDHVFQDPQGLRDPIIYEHEIRYLSELERVAFGYGDFNESVGYDAAEGEKAVAPVVFGWNTVDPSNRFLGGDFEMVDDDLRRDGHFERDAWIPGMGYGVNDSHMSMDATLASDGHGFLNLAQRDFVSQKVAVTPWRWHELSFDVALPVADTPEDYLGEIAVQVIGGSHRVSDVATVVEQDGYQTFTYRFSSSTGAADIVLENVSRGRGISDQALRIDNIEVNEYGWQPQLGYAPVDAPSHKIEDLSFDYAEGAVDRLGLTDFEDSRFDGMRKQDAETGEIYLSGRGSNANAGQLFYAFPDLEPGKQYLLSFDARVAGDLRYGAPDGLVVTYGATHGQFSVLNEEIVFREEQGDFVNYSFVFTADSSLETESRPSVLRILDRHGWKAPHDSAYEVHLDNISLKELAYTVEEGARGGEALPGFGELGEAPEEEAFIETGRFYLNENSSYEFTWLGNEKARVFLDDALILDTSRPGMGGFSNHTPDSSGYVDVKVVKFGRDGELGVRFANEDAAFRSILTRPTVGPEMKPTVALNAETSEEAVYLIGSGRDDVLIGSDGADLLVGGDGDNVLKGGAGDDLYFASAGADVFSFLPEDGRSRHEIDVLDGFWGANAVGDAFELGFDPAHGLEAYRLGYDLVIVSQGPDGHALVVRSWHHPDLQSQRTEDPFAGLGGLGPTLDPGFMRDLRYQDPNLAARILDSEPYKASSGYAGDAAVAQALNDEFARVEQRIQEAEASAATAEALRQDAGRMVATAIEDATPAHDLTAVADGFTGSYESGSRYYALAQISMYDRSSDEVLESGMSRYTHSRNAYFKFSTEDFAEDQGYVFELTRLWSRSQADRDNLSVFIADAEWNENTLSRRLEHSFEKPIRLDATPEAVGKLAYGQKVRFDVSEGLGDWFKENPDAKTVTLQVSQNHGERYFFAAATREFHNADWRPSLEIFESTHEFALRENVSGAEIAHLNMVDGVWGNEHSFSVSDDRFEVRSVNGKHILALKADAALDYEAESEATFIVTATDEKGASTQARMTVAVLDEAGDAQPTAAPNSAPEVETKDHVFARLAPSATVDAATLVNTADADGDAIVRYQLRDTQGQDSWVVDGRAVDASNGYVVDSLDGVEIARDVAAKHQKLALRVSDGEDWSEWSDIAVTTMDDFDGFRAPRVFASIMTTNDAEEVTLRMQGVHSDGFKIKMEEDERADRWQRHGTEEVGVVAMESGSYENGVVGATGSTVTHQFRSAARTDHGDAFIASMQTYNGPDTAALRYREYYNTYQVMVEEETVYDRETGHARENVAFAALDSGLIEDFRGEVVGAVGTVTFRQGSPHQWHSVDLKAMFGEKADFDDMVVVLGPPSYRGPDDSLMRMRGVDSQSDSFQFKLDEWSSDDVHATETVGFMVFEAGAHVLAGGKEVYADTLELTNMIWKDVALPDGDLLV